MNNIAMRDVEKYIEPTETKKKKAVKTEQEQYIEFVCETLDNLKELFIKKNKQYANADPLKNFRTGSSIRYRKTDLASMFETAKDYENKHIAHLYDSTIDGGKLDESLGDIIVYSAIELYMINQYKESKEK